MQHIIQEFILFFIDIFAVIYVFGIKDENNVEKIRTIKEKKCAA